MDAILTDTEALWGPLDDADSPDDIITRFACSVRDDKRDWLYEFHFACHQRDVIWDDCENYRLEIEDPAVAVGFEVLEMSDGRIEAITPRGMCLLLFSGPNRKAISGALRSALLLENQRLLSQNVE